jgi:hypothetical protein
MGVGIVVLELALSLCFCNFFGCKYESVTFADFEGKHMAPCNVTLGKCIREKGFVVVNL